MSKKKQLHDGSKIYDTPKSLNTGCYAGFNGYFEDGYPTYAVGSTCKYTAYWERQLFRRLSAILDFKVPNNWDKDYFLWVLYRMGYVGIVETKVYGIIPQFGTLHGRNVFYLPTRFLVANPLIPQHNFTLEENCVVIKLNPDYSGVWDIVHEYGEQLGMLTQSLHMAIVNTRIVDGYVTDSNAAAQAIRTMLQMVDDGAPTIVLNSEMLNKPGSMKDEKTDLPWKEIHNEVGKNYIIDKILSDIETTINMFCREIGVPVLSDKKERQISSEVNATVGAALTAIDVWYDTLTHCIEKAKEIFPGLELSVSKENYTGGVQNEPAVESGKTE